MLKQFGIDLRKMFNSIAGLRKYLSDYKNFDSGDWKLRKYPCLHEYKEQAGSVEGHYFHQDLLIAQKIFKNKPKEHFDVGSRIDGFVSNVATFMKIDIMDIRPLKSKVDNIHFMKGDLCGFQIEELASIKKYDSVSCLHTIEHMGLGRYGDDVIKDGYKIAIKNLKGMTAKGGVLYLSVPISNRQRIEFNAHRVFNIKTILDECKDLELVSFSFVDDEGELHKNIEFNDDLPKNIELNGEIECDFGLGIFEFRKKSFTKVRRTKYGGSIIRRKGRRK